MSHILGVYWAPGHQRPTDIDYIKRLQPPAIRILDPDPNQLTIAFHAAPDALLLPRDWSLSEQHDDVRRDPVGTGKRHAQDWRGKIDRWRASGAPLPPDNQIIVVGMNELQVWNMLPQAVEYTVAMLDESTRLGLRACALNLSVGWPANNGADTPPDWEPYAPVEAAIKRGNHILVVHSYWYKSGPQDGAGWWAWRHRACPWDVPIIIGECSVDLYVDMKRWENDGKPNRGWRGNISPEQYAAQMEEYARGCDRRVVAILPFLTDYRSNNWESFDTADAHSALLTRKDRMIPQAAPPTAPTPPPIDVDESEGDGPSAPPPPVDAQLIYPCQGTTTQRWGENPQEYARFDIPGHNGWDIANQEGTPVVAVADGVVAFIGDDADYGNYLRVTHAQLGFDSFYAHLKSIGVSVGSVVRQGQEIAAMGSTGNATGSHLHLEFRLTKGNIYIKLSGGYGKGRVDPMIVYWLLNREAL